MKVLLDHNLDRRLKRYLLAFDCKTVHEMNWDTLKNGELLNAAEEAGFKVLLTADTNMQYQQNLKQRKISILIIRAPDNRLSTHAQMANQIQHALKESGLYEIAEVIHPSLA